MEEQEQIKKSEEDKKLTFDEVLQDSEYQSAYDKKVALALENAKVKWQKEADEKKSEAEKLAKMDAETKSKYELEKERKAKEEAISKLNAYELKETATKIAKEKELDVDLLDLIDFTKETADSIRSKIETIDTIYKKSVEKGIKNALKEETPKNINNNTQKQARVSRASF